MMWPVYLLLLAILWFSIANYLEQRENTDRLQSLHRKMEGREW